jgi:hypothetical protein
MTRKCAFITPVDSNLEVNMVCGLKDGLAVVEIGTLKAALLMFIVVKQEITSSSSVSIMVSPTLNRYILTAIVENRFMLMLQERRLVILLVSLTRAISELLIERAAMVFGLAVNQMNVMATVALRALIVLPSTLMMKLKSTFSIEHSEIQLTIGRAIPKVESLILSCMADIADSLEM